MTDWKHLATTTGYKSLKAAYIRDVQGSAKQKRPMRDKTEFLCKFQWVINRAKHYAHHTGKSMEAILNEWEAKRDYWWLNYYQNGRQPKFHSDGTKTMGVNGVRKYCKKQNYSPEHIRSAVNRVIYGDQEKERVKTKPRWDTARKKRGF